MKIPYSTAARTIVSTVGSFMFIIMICGAIFAFISLISIFGSDKKSFEGVFSIISFFGSFFTVLIGAIGFTICAALYAILETAKNTRDMLTIMQEQELRLKHNESIQLTH